MKTQTKQRQKTGNMDQKTKTNSKRTNQNANRLRKQKRKQKGGSELPAQIVDINRQINSIRLRDQGHGLTLTSCTDLSAIYARLVPEQIVAEIVE